MKQNSIKRYFLLFLLCAIFLSSYAQPCMQPGALVSVRNFEASNHEYIVFKFIKPYAEKGILSKTTSDFFLDTKKEGTSYHRLVFNNVTHYCVNKLKFNNGSKKLINFKPVQKDQLMITYVFQLAAGAKVSAHYVSQHHNHYFVKIRID